MSWLSSFFVANSISEAGVPVEIPMSSYCKELVRWKPSGFGCIFLIFTSENGELSIEKTLWMELATLHAYLSCTFAWLSHFDRSEHLHGFLSNLSKYSLPFGLFVLFVFRFSFTSQRSFVCTFEIVWAVQDRRIPDRKGANQIRRFYRKWFQPYNIYYQESMS